MSLSLRPPVVAGRFYPADPDRLRRTVQGLIVAAGSWGGGSPKAIIAPHASYAYSGAVAASAFATLGSSRGTIRRVVLLGTAHSPVLGMASSGFDGFETPLGVVPVDREAIGLLADLPQVIADDRAHEVDHALEVELPFVQVALGDVAIVPLLVGRCMPESIAEVLDRLWGDDGTRIVVSSDLSHYRPAIVASRLDRETADAIEALDPGRLGKGSACGWRAIAGLLLAAEEHGLRASTVDLRHSGDFGSPDDRVVGYGAFAFVPAGE